MVGVKGRSSTVCVCVCMYVCVCVCVCVCCFANCVCVSMCTRPVHTCLPQAMPDETPPPLPSPQMCPLLRGSNNPNGKIKFYRRTFFFAISVPKPLGFQPHPLLRPRVSVVCEKLIFSFPYRPNFQDLRKYLILWAKCVYARKKKTNSKNELIFQGQASETVKGCAKVRKNDIILCTDAPVFLFVCRRNAQFAITFSSYPP